MKEIYNRWTKNKKSGGSGNVVVEMKDWLADINQNVIFKMIIGKRISEATYTHGDLIGRKVFKDWFRMNETFVVSDALPFLRWLDLGGHEKTMRKVAKEVDQVVQGWLEEHKQKKNRTISSGVKGNEGERDFVDLMLSVLDDANLEPKIFTRRHVGVLDKKEKNILAVQRGSYAQAAGNPLSTKTEVPKIGNNSKSISSNPFYKVIPKHIPFKLC
ncbi:hypothetical protein ACFX16_032137 [Malus domestica]